METSQYYTLRLEALQLAHKVLDDKLKHNATSPEQVIHTADNFVNYILHGKK